MDFGALTPEVNSARMYAGPGPESMLAAAAAWKGLAADLQSAATAYTSSVSGLTSGPWLGPSSSAMLAAAAPFAAWMSATAGQAELAGTQAQAAAGAYETAFSMTVPPPVIAANRTQLASLVSTNILGQNTPAIAATEAQYGEMWAQDAAAMYGYAANSAATIANATPFTAAPQITNTAGLATQGAAVAQAAGTTGTGVQSTLSQLVSAIPTALQSLASPGSSATGLSGILSSLLGGSSSASAGTGALGGLLGSGMDGFSLGGLLESYASYPGFAAVFLAISPLETLISSPLAAALTPSATLADVDGAAGADAVDGGLGSDAAGAALGSDAAEGGLGSGFVDGAGGFADSGTLAGLGEAASAGALSVPPSWGWAAAGPAAMLGGAPLALALPDLDLGAAGALPLAAGLPLMMGGLPRAAAAGTGSTTAAKYGPARPVVARPPAAGYPPLPESPAAQAYPVPAGFPTNGHAPPGYRPAIVYLPVNGNGHAPAKV